MTLSTAVQEKNYLVCRRIAAIMSVLMLTLLLPTNVFSYQTSTTGNGNQINARYYHLSQIDVVTGTSISKGTKVGEVGWDGLENESQSHLHIDFNWIPATNSQRFSQDYMAANPTYIINTVDMFPGLQYWAYNSGYVYINS